MTQQNVTQVAAEHAQTPSLRARLRVMATLHNISPGFLRRHVTYRATPERRTGVRVADDAGERLRQEMVQAPVGRGLEPARPAGDAVEVGALALDGDEELGREPLVRCANRSWAVIPKSLAATRGSSGGRREPGRLGASEEASHVTLAASGSG